MKRWPFKARAVRHIPGKMNKTEAAYADYLGILKLAGKILFFEFECVTLKLGKDLRYTPDFMVVTLDGTVEFHEVKGSKTSKSGDIIPYFKDDGLVKLRAAAKQFPFVFLTAFRQGSNWIVRDETEGYEEMKAA